MALGAIRSDAAACLIEPLSVTARKYLTAVDSIIRPLGSGSAQALLKILAGAG
jgi:hypothetical protein